MKSGIFKQKYAAKFYIFSGEICCALHIGISSRTAKFLILVFLHAYSVKLRGRGRRQGVSQRYKADWNSGGCSSRYRRLGWWQGMRSIVEFGEGLDPSSEKKHDKRFAGKIWGQSASASPTSNSGVLVPLFPPVIYAHGVSVFWGYFML